MPADAPIERLLSQLVGVQGRGPRYRARCPVHESKRGSRTLAITEGDGGAVLLHCFAGCQVADIARAVGLDLADLFPAPHDRDGRSRYTDGERQRVRKPWAARDVVAALGHELTVAWVVLNDVAAGREIKDGDRQRAGVARERIGHLIGELQGAG